MVKTTTTITAFTMFAVIMGMSAIAPAFAVSPPADPSAGDNVPEISCEDLEDFLVEEGVDEEAIQRILELAGCI